MNKLFLFGILFVLLISFTSAITYNINNFTDGTNSENITFIGSIFKNISILKNANVTKATIDLIGFNITSCYQETANISTSCGGLSTGTYSYNGSWNAWLPTMWDENWSTGSLPLSETGWSAFFINYSKPSNYLNSSLWNVNANSTVLHGVNISIPSDCWNLSVLQLSINSLAQAGGGYDALAYCKNNTGWKFLQDLSSGPTVYEEAMWWDINDIFPTNVSIRVNKNITYQNLSIFNIFIDNLNLNITLLQYCVDSCIYPSGVNCLCEINFTSATIGTLGYSDINISYNLDLSIDNCSTYTIRALNITVFSDYDNTLENTNIDGYFETSLIEIGEYSNFSLVWGGINNSGICISSNYISFQSDLQLQYGGTGAYPLETHYLTNYNLSNVTQLLNLYLTPNSTLVKFTVTDQDDTVLQGVYINVLKYDFGTNSYTTTEILKTDELGQALGSIVLSTQWYKFMLVYNGAVVLETDPVKITSTTRNFRVDLVENFYDYYDTWNNIQSSLTFTNATHNFAYTFINTNGASVTACLNVVRIKASNNIFVNESCVTASSGTILVNIGAVADGTFKAVGSIEASPLDISEVLVVTLGTEYKKWGKDGIFAAFLVRLTLAMVGIWNPVVAIILMVTADILMVSAGLYFMNWQAIMFYVILAGVVMYRINRRS